jgi:hypothetical protein
MLFEAQLSKSVCKKLRPKETRKRRNKAELLRGDEDENDLLLSPLFCTTSLPPSSL